MGVTKNSLIAIAKKNRIKRSSEYTQDEVDLALAWVDDDVSLQGVDKAMQGRGRGGVLYLLGLCSSPALA